MEPKLIYNRADLARLCEVTEKTLDVWILKKWIEQPLFRRKNKQKFWSMEQAEQIKAWRESRKK